MGVDVMKQQLIERIQNGDELLIRVIFAVSEALEEDISQEEVLTILPPAGSRITMKELIAEIEEADAEIDRGEFLTSEELEKEMEQW
ncbi:hypothetical protein [Lewinella sp. LCG006]|uniref:hypothetical protein n=1 Tax=Lewinella sp. LCG006 TaxID=3231911 RepID=UPI00345FD4CA